MKQFAFNQEEALASIQEKGYFVANGALNPLVLSDLQIAFRRYMHAGPSSSEGLGIHRTGDVCWIDHPLTISPVVVHLALSEILLSTIAEYLGAPSCFSYAFAYRTIPVPGMTDRVQSSLVENGQFKGWHSDANLTAPARGYRCIVAMLYLSDVAEGDGGIWLVEGSHQFGGLKRVWEPKEFEDHRCFEVTAKAGSLVIFDMEMIHRAGTPTHSRPRDIVRFMYSPVGGFSQHMLIPMHYLPENLSHQQSIAANFGRFADQHLPLSGIRDNLSYSKRPQSSPKTRLKRALIEFLLKH